MRRHARPDVRAHPAVDNRDLVVVVEEDVTDPQELLDESDGATGPGWRYPAHVQQPRAGGGLDSAVSRGTPETGPGALLPAGARVRVAELGAAAVGDAGDRGLHMLERTTRPHSIQQR